MSCNGSTNSDYSAIIASQIRTNTTIEVSCLQTTLREVHQRLSFQVRVVLSVEVSKPENSLRQLADLSIGREEVLIRALLSSKLLSCQVLSSCIWIYTLDLVESLLRQADSSYNVSMINHQSGENKDGDIEKFQTDTTIQVILVNSHKKPRSLRFRRETSAQNSKPSPSPHFASTCILQPRKISTIISVLSPSSNGTEKHIF
jgi:hypothetical protein